MGKFSIPFLFSVRSLLVYRLDTEKNSTALMRLFFLEITVVDKKKKKQLSLT